MPLLDMSPNIQESDLASRKRSHDLFAETTSKKDGVSIETPAIKVEDALAINGALQGE
jgi:hypothetical protein